MVSVQANDMQACAHSSSYCSSYPKDVLVIRSKVSSIDTIVDLLQQYPEADKDSEEGTHAERKPTSMQVNVNVRLLVIGT